MAKALKRANKTGSVYKLSGKRRKPWRAVVTLGWDINEETGKLIQLRATLGYFRTKDEALQALFNYIESPYNIKRESITFEEVYKLWSDDYFPTLGGKSSIRTITAAYKYCKPLYKMRMKDIRTEHLERTIKDAKIGNSTKGRMKSLFNLMFDYAMKYDIVNKNYARLSDPVKREGPIKVPIPFSQEEINLLWENIYEIPFVDMILIGIYSGWRPQELAILKTADIDLEEETMKGGLKTDAGKNRIVPIHPIIYPLIEKLYSKENEYLFNDENGQQGTHMTYDKYRNRFVKVMKRLKLDHRPHETRHTFITKAKECNVDEYVLKLIVGHAITDLTEKTYTHRTIEQFKTEIRKITK